MHTTTLHLTDIMCVYNWLQQHENIFVLSMKLYLQQKFRRRRFGSPCHFSSTLYLLDEHHFPHRLYSHVTTVTTLPHLPTGHNGRHFSDDILECTFVNDQFCILISISLNFVLSIGFDKRLAPNMHQAITWTKPRLSSSMTHICGTRGWWVKCTNKDIPRGCLNAIDRRL